MDEYKFCFIICSNKEYYLEECLLYINQLEIPVGYSVDVISISGAESMASGYNEGMKATDAKYKIYMHQDVFIVYKGFLQSVLEIFQSDAEIGMIGMVGASKMPTGAVMWYTDREGAIYGSSSLKEEYSTYSYQLADGLHEVEAIDGLMLITGNDLPWREDKFDGWDFYDISQSYEFRRHAYKVVVPEQLNPWCVHDCGWLSMNHFDKYRKIFMEEYLNDSEPKRFRVGKSNELQQGPLRVVIIARNQFEAVKCTIESVKMMSKVTESQIIVVDNGSNDGLRHWLPRQQGIDYIICEEMIEGYAEILNEVVKQFIDKEDLLVFSAGLMMLPGCVEALYEVLNEDVRVGAVCARMIAAHSVEGKNYSDAAVYAMQHADVKEKKAVLGLPHEAVLIRNEMLRQLDGFEHQLMLPKSTMVDFAFRGIKKNYLYYEVQNAFVYKILNSNTCYIELLGRDVDRSILKQKWQMNYFNEHPNDRLLELVKEEKNREFDVLEIGCDCGVNLLHLKNEYPHVHLYGVEINSGAAAIAAHVAKVQLANIEDKALDFEGKKFDYIILGDVLEHLRDPEGTVLYCKELLKKDGRILTCIPNLMHFTVMRQLLNGDFTYTDTGLLDRTHIHLFTYNEILRMFEKTGYEVETISHTGGIHSATKEDREFVNKLLSLSDVTDEFMYYTIQYIMSVKKK